MSNTRTLLFTQVPHTIEREWTCKECDLSGIVDDAVPRSVYESIITRINLTVDFNTAFQDIPDMIGEEEDVKDDRIENWKNAQRTYFEIVEAINPIVRKLVKQTYEEASKNKVEKTTLLKRIQTKFHKSSRSVDDVASQITTPQRSPIIGRAETIVPGDSVTRIGTSVSKSPSYTYAWARRRKS